MNTKTKVIIAGACAAVIVGSALSFKKVRDCIIKIAKAEEPGDEKETHNVKRAADDCRYMADIGDECCDTSCEAMPCEETCSPRMTGCDAMKSMSKVRLVD